MNKLFLKNKSGAGFTLVELLVVISCISILVAMAAPSYALMQKNIGLSNGAQELVNALRWAQNMAISSQGGVDHNVSFQNNGYFLDGTAQPPLDNGVQIITGVNKEIAFRKLTGTASICDTANCIPTLNDCTPTTCEIKIGFSDKQKTIQVDAVGRISITQ